MAADLTNSALQIVEAAEAHLKAVKADLRSNSPTFSDAEIQAFRDKVTANIGGMYFSAALNDPIASMTDEWIETQPEFVAAVSAAAAAERAYRAVAPRGTF